MTSEVEELAKEILVGKYGAFSVAERPSPECEVWEGEFEAAKTIAEHLLCNGWRKGEPKSEE